MLLTSYFWFLTPQLVHKKKWVDKYQVTHRKDSTPMPVNDTTMTFRRNYNEVDGFNRDTHGGVAWSWKENQKLS